MKKALSLVLAVVLMLSMATFAFADNNTTLTTTVPAATYTLNIPADQEIPFGATSTDIGSITVTQADGFAKGKNLKVTMTLSPFSSEGVSTTIPYTLRLRASDTNSEDPIDINSGDAITFLGKSDGSVDEYIEQYILNSYASMDETLLIVTSSDWSKALAGAYTATITYTAEVVVEE